MISISAAGSTLSARSLNSPGAIAGTVVGSVIGAIILMAFSFFLCLRPFWRWRSRNREDVGSEKSVSEKEVSLPKPGEPGYLPHRSTFPLEEVPSPTIKSDESVHRSAKRAEAGLSTASTLKAETSIVTPPTHEVDRSSDASDNSHVNKEEEETASPTEVETSPTAANASYYDASVPMDSDPEQAPAMGLTRQMSELYKEQLRQAREKRRERKGSRSSTLTKLISSVKGKRQTQCSDNSRGVSRSPSSDYPIASIERSEHDGGPWDQGYGPAICEEPQVLEDGAESHGPGKERIKLQGSLRDESETTQPRLDSLNTALRQKPTHDPWLPSSAMSPTTRTSPTINTQGVSEARRATRLGSPEIPSPMDVNPSEFQGRASPEALRSSYSPEVEPKTFVSPMAIMRPTNQAEKAAYNEAELERIENSVSPPHSPPHITDDHAGYDGGAEEGDEFLTEDAFENEMIGVVEETVEDSWQVDNELMVTGEEHDEGPSDVSTPPGQTLTSISSGRTPDTRITASPSSPAYNQIKMESSASPDTAHDGPSPTSPQSLMCSECGRMFDQIHKLNHHKRYHDRKHNCPFPGCEKRFGTKTHLDRHINDKHEKKKGYHCPDPSCPYSRGGKAFPRKDNWRRHMQNKHNVNPQVEPEAMDIGGG